MKMKNKVKKLRSKYGRRGDTIIYKQGFFRIDKIIKRILTIWFYHDHDHDQYFEVYRVFDGALLQKSPSGFILD